MFYTPVHAKSPPLNILTVLRGDCIGSKELSQATCVCMYVYDVCNSFILSLFGDKYDQTQIAAEFSRFYRVI